MPNRKILEIMKRGTGDRRVGSHAFSAAVALSCAVMLSVTVAAVTRVTSWWPLQLESRLLLRPLSGSDWGAPWTPGNTVTSVDHQLAGFHQLGLVVLALSVIGALVAVVSFVALRLGAASVRRREFATRAALGASPHELVMGLIAESAVFSGVALVFGGIAGVLLSSAVEALWPHAVIAQSIAEHFLRAGVAAAIVCGGAVVTTVFFAWVSVLRGPLAPVLTGGSRITATEGELQVRDALAVLQFAGVLVLLSGAFVMARESRPDLATTSPARPELYVARLELQGPAFDDAATRAALLKRLQQQIAAVPGVRAETLSSVGAWLGLGTQDMSVVECGICFRGGMYMPFDAPRVRLMSVMPGFFELLEIEVEQGRGFTAADSLGSGLSAIVNRPLASSSFESGKPVGRAAQPHGLSAPTYKIQGAVAPTRAPVIGSTQQMDNVMYLSALQQPPRSLDVLVFVDEPAIALAALEELRRELPAGASLAAFVSSAEVIRELGAPMRLLAVVLAVLAAVVLLLGLHGAYVLQHFRVFNLQRDMGVRLALGATPRMLTRHVLHGAFNLVLAGLVIGGFGALAAMRTVQLLVPTAPRFAADLFITIGLVLTATALLGALWPARKAGCLQPGIVLNS